MFANAPRLTKSANIFFREQFPIYVRYFKAHYVNPCQIHAGLPIDYAMFYIVHVVPANAGGLIGFQFIVNT